MPKIVNYTPEQVTELVETYNSAENDDQRKNVVENMAIRLGKSTRSIVAKLSREGVYQKPARAAKRGGVKKNDVASAIAAVVQLSENDADSLTKANLTALNKVWAFIREASGEVGSESS